NIFFYNDHAPTEIYTLSLHDALPISSMANKKIKIKGARAHNLKNVDIEIPKNKFVVVTGLSGSGKSSLAFDTIYAEGQRRYVERSEEHTSELQSRFDLVCRLLLEKKK